MDTSKIRAALEDLQAQRARIDDAIDALTKVIEAESGPTATPNRGLTFPKPFPLPSSVAMPRTFSFGTRRAPDSYLAIAVEVLKDKGGPMHVAEITSAIAEKKGVPTAEVSRASVEGSLARAIKQGYAGLERTAPSTFNVKFSENSKTKTADDLV